MYGLLLYRSSSGAPKNQAFQLLVAPCFLFAVTDLETDEVQRPPLSDSIVIRTRGKL